MPKLSKNRGKSTDVYQLITDRIVAQLEKGQVPWRKSWSEAGLPQNLITKKPYRGLNVWLLASLGYTQNYFLTFKQAKQLGGSVIKGEKSCPVVFWKWVEYEDKESEEVKKVPFLRYYSVFNVEQCEGIPEDKIPKIETNQNNPIQACEQIVQNMPQRPPIKHQEQRAFYSPPIDFVNMPKMETFIDSESYYATLFHELVHSTGHENRLNRPEVTDFTFFGSHEYSKEELTAEIGACYLTNHAGIGEKHFDNNIAYIQGWLNKLRNDKKFIVYASARAQNATDFILNKQVNTQPTETPETIPVAA